MMLRSRSRWIICLICVLFMHGCVFILAQYQKKLSEKPKTQKIVVHMHTIQLSAEPVSLEKTIVKNQEIDPPQLIPIVEKPSIIEAPQLLSETEKSPLKDIEEPKITKPAEEQKIIKKSPTPPPPPPKPKEKLAPVPKKLPPSPKPVTKPVIKEAPKPIPKPKPKTPEVPAKVSKAAPTTPVPKKEIPKQEENDIQKQQLLKAMQDSLAKMDSLTSKTATITKETPKQITQLNIDTSPRVQASKDIASMELSYREELIRRLKIHLKLPEIGEVKIQLTVERDGLVKKLIVVNAESEKNRSYVEKALPKLSMPHFGDRFKDKSDYTFPITLSNE